MKRLLLLALVAGLLAFAMRAQWRSYDRMGERRFAALAHPRSELLVGVCWPFSVNQDGMADGLQLAEEEINAGGLAGRPVRLVLRDDAFDWEKGKRIATEFADTPEMSAVVGYYDDSFAVKASPIYEASRLLHLIVGANATSLTGHGFSYVVRTTLSSDKIARELAQMSYARGARKFAILWEEDAYGEDLAYQYRVSLDALDAQLVYQRSYSRERGDFRLPVNQLRGNDSEVIFFAGLEPLAGDFLRAARLVGLRQEIIGAFSDTPEMRRSAGPALEGARYFEMYSAAAPTRENQAFVEKFRARFGRTPDTWAAQGYDALHLLARAARATGSVNPLDLSYAVRYADAWEGANGRYKFDAQGELEDKPIYLVEIRKGQPVTIQESKPGVVDPRLQ
jgi:branched-chain amino acid transport system substrate-binding protein